MKLLLIVLVTLPGISCSKLDILNEQPATNLVIPSTLEDLSSLLNDTYSMNRTPGLGEVSADNYALVYTYWQTLRATERNAHTWAQNIYEADQQIEDWLIPYRQVLNCNVILEGLAQLTITANNSAEWRRIKGAALFFKAHAIFQLAQVFAPPFDSARAATDMGVPLRPSAAITVKSERATVEQTYSLILAHLKEAATLLGTFDRSQPDMPSRPAALGLLARTYLTMGVFDSALVYATSTLQQHPTIQDYNGLNLNLNSPFKEKSPEILFLTEMVSSATCLKGVITPGTLVDPALLSLYHPDDLRRQSFFQVNPSTGSAGFKASYSGAIYAFTGIATDELILIQAECQARLGKWMEAMTTLNGLLTYRWKSGTFVPLTAGNAAGALHIILEERRKELPLRGLRWTDLRRLSKENLTPTIERKLDGKRYQLPPQDKRYVLPVPYDIITMTGMPQNPR